MKSFYLLIILTSLALSACVSSKKYKGLQAERADLINKLGDCKSVTAQLNKSIEDCQKTVKKLKGDTTDLGRKLRECLGKYDGLSKNYDQFKSQASSGEQTLLKRLEDLEQDLRNRELRLKEVERRLAMRDSVLAALQKRLADALLRFKDSGLSVYQKNGKVYVSLSDRLLFESGKTAVNSEGKNALKDVASVLNQQMDIQIEVEGHTDSIPIKSGTMKDNWDLSVLRSTEVVRILTQDCAVSPARVTATGHGEYYPIAPNSTKEGRAQNRRTDIVLTPNLEDLYKILDSK